MTQQHPFRSTTHDERFYHFNGHNHLTGVRRGCTLFARKEDDGHWSCSLSICHANDAFCRKRGRTTARRRYFAEPLNRVKVGPEITFEAAAAAAAHLLAALLPRRVA